MLIFVKSKVTDGFCAMSRVVAMLMTIGEKEDFPSVYWGTWTWHNFFFYFIL